MKGLIYLNFSFAAETAMIISALKSSFGLSTCPRLKYFSCLLHGQKNYKKLLLLFGFITSKIEYFMSRLPKDKIPRLDSQGAMYRLKELVYQMPLQDFSSKHCRKLPLEQKMVMDDMCITRINKALGVGEGVFLFY